MKKQVLTAYRVLVPERVKQRIPPRLKAAVLGLAYDLTGYPDLRLWQMRHLYKVGDGEKRSLNIADPLLSCALRPTAPAPEADRSPGSFYGEFGFLGLKINGRVRDRAAVADGKVDLWLDGHLLRRIGLVPSPDGTARILFTIRRPALEMFPERGKLAIRDLSGRPLHVDLRFFRSDQRPDTPCTGIDFDIPFGAGTLPAHLEQVGTLDKKGWPRLTDAELVQRQSRMLELYGRVNAVFQEEFGRPLFLLYGTLLGQVREGDFIPGDDDFDVGYVSEARTTPQIKAEAVQIMERLVARGFIVSLNHLGRPHRIRDVQSGGPEIHLDNHIVFAPGDGHVWIHPRARLPLPLDAFRAVETVTMRGVEVIRPAGAEAFLEAHYGSDWRIPDPGYANFTTAQDRAVARLLRAVCLTRKEQRSLARGIQQRQLPGEFVAASLEHPYPIENWARRVGF